MLLRETKRRIRSHRAAQRTIRKGLLQKLPAPNRADQAVWVAAVTATPWRRVRAERREPSTHTFILILFEFPGCIEHFAAVGRGNGALGGIQVKRAFVNQ